MIRKLLIVAVASLVVAVTCVAGAAALLGGGAARESLSYAQLSQKLDQNAVAAVTIRGSTLEVRDKANRRFRVIDPNQPDPSLGRRLATSGASVSYAPANGGVLPQLLFDALPVLLNWVFWCLLVVGLAALALAGMRLAAARRAN
jgi:hypothetical protein